MVSSGVFFTIHCYSYYCFILFVEVANQLGTEIASEIIPSLSSVPQPCQSPNTCGYLYPSPYQIFFLANLPAAGFRTYKLVDRGSDRRKAEESNNNNNNNKRKERTVRKVSGVNSIENQFLKLDFDVSTGLLRAITQKKTNLRMNISQNFYYYNATWTLARHGKVNGRE
jgi:hypothetical protein